MPPNINQPGQLKTGAPQIPNQPPREPGELQPEDVVAAQEISGFSGARVFITLQKKTESKLKKLPNQDNILVHPNTGLVAVMDGVGGSVNGELASRVTERELPKHFETAESVAKKMSATELIEELTEIPAERYEYWTDSASKKAEIEKTAKEIVSKDVGLARKAYALLKALQDTNFMVATTRGATTACAGLIHETANGEKFAIIANVGDSGAFIR